MLFLKDTTYAKVWKITKADKYLDLQISTSEKDKEGNYINSSWFPRCVSGAFDTLKDTLKEGDRITITKAKLSNERYTDKDGKTKSRFRFLIIEANISDQNSNAPAAQNPAPSAPSLPANDDLDCPW